MTVGAFGSLVAGGVLVWRERRRNQLTGQRWLRFWQSKLGAWSVTLAGLGLPRFPAERSPLDPLPEDPGRSPLPRPAEQRLAAPDPLDDLDDVLGRTESCIRRVRAHLALTSATREREGRAPALQEVESERTLERQVVALEALLARFIAVDLEALLARFIAVDTITGVPGSLTADLAAAREICAVVEGLIAGREWRG
jgi:hypothetical protein